MYFASPGGIRVFFHSLATRIFPIPVHVLCICPGELDVVSIYL